MKTTKHIATALSATLLAAVIAVAAAIILGGPGEPASLASINNPFKDVDYTSLPAVATYATRQGDRLAYRYYAAAPGPVRNPVVLVHGSSASSKSMHAMASGFAEAGHPTWALDIRGHGDSGKKGDIDHVGQLEEDLEDFVTQTALAPSATLVGFSSGGGFVLRVAGGPKQKLFANYLLLSPFIHQDAPTVKPGTGGWVSVGIPRYVALGILDRLGIRSFGYLPVMRFALNNEARAFLTPTYSFRLAQNFRPRSDYVANIQAVSHPFAVLAGSDDELFDVERFASVFSAAGKAVPVTIIPGTGHVGLTLKPEAIKAAVAAVDRLNKDGNMPNALAFAPRNDG
ncbi:MAG: Alpha/beta hydrolase family protein [Herminiimonas sp.]|nr:Alpha/beta hydrolase family protein [Herminiimonas sp.]MDB5854758.1 Alpha/beta hydrolase family protein [Herminiimonas sp.]